MTNRDKYKMLHDFCEHHSKCSQCILYKKDGCYRDEPIDEAFAIIKDNLKVHYKISLDIEMIEPFDESQYENIRTSDEMVQALRELICDSVTIAGGVASVDSSYHKLEIY